MPEIVVKFDSKIVERVVTEKEHLSIGRTSDNDIVLDNRGVSRKHARIEVCGEDAIVIDNESLNGTFVNNRRVNEEKLRDNDVITIGKFDLEFRAGFRDDEKMSDHDGTMILNTKRQKEMIKKDKEDKEVVRRAGCSVFLGLEKTNEEEIPLEREVTTFGKSKFVNHKVAGFFVSGIQAKVIREGQSFTLMNVGRSGKTRVNGEEVITADLKNGDIVQIGKSAFRFVEAN